MENFMKSTKKAKEVLLVVIAGLILLSVIYGLLFFFGGTVLSLLGLKYDTLWSLGKFFAILLILGSPIDFIVVCFLKVIKELRQLTNFQYNLLYFGLDIPLTMIMIGIAESLIKGVSCSMLTAFIFAIICFLFYLFLDKKADEIDN